MAEHREAVRRLKPEELHVYRGYLRTGRLPLTRARETSGTSNGRVRGSRRNGSSSSTRLTSSSSSSGDDPPPEPEPAERRCEAPDCDAVPPPGKRYCEGRCRTAAHRHRLLLDHLDQLVGSVTAELSCRCAPPGGVADGVCLKCGRPRGPVVRGWDTDLLPCEDLRGGEARELSAPTTYRT
jgi:hypothetical protein